jgi:chromosome segregation ATPase
MRLGYAFALCGCLAAVGAGMGGCAHEVVNSAGPSAALSQPEGTSEQTAAAELASEREHTAALEAVLDDFSRDIAKLHIEISRLHEREAQLSLAVEGTPQRAAPAPADAAAAAEANARIAALEGELAQERQRRTDVEEQLARLKAETAAPPFGKPPDLEEMARLRNELEQERSQRESLLLQVAELRRQLDDTPRVQPTAEADGKLRARMVELENRHQEAMASLARTLESERKRNDELADQLSSARTQAAAVVQQAALAPVVATDDKAFRAEGARLRSQLEEERLRNAELAAKLKLAGRVMDLIFRLQPQGAETAPAPQR